MKGKQLFMIILLAVVTAVAAVIILKYLGYDNTTVTAGAVAGGVAGAVSASFMKKNKDS